jgi:hypothetical protein
MQSAIYGMYKDGKIIFEEPEINKNNSRVLVVFLDEESENSREQKLMELFELYGPWEDNRDVETIISDIQNSRKSKDNIVL